MKAIIITFLPEGTYKRRIFPETACKKRERNE